MFDEEDKSENWNYSDHNQHDDAPDLTFLMLLCLLQRIDSVFHLQSAGLDILINSIEQRSLYHDQTTQLSHDIVELVNRTDDIEEFFVAFSVENWLFLLELLIVEIWVIKHLLCGKLEEWNFGSVLYLFSILDECSLLGSNLSCFLLNLNR